jgi:hypothetical protein
VRQYGFKNIAFLVEGVPISGFAEGDDVIAGDRSVEEFTHVVGADGDMLVLQSSDESGRIVVKLQQGSPSSAYLGNLFAQLSRGTFRAIDVRAVDVQSGEQIGGTKAYIAKPAPVSRGMGANQEEWSFGMEKYDAFFAGLTEL